MGLRKPTERLPSAGAVIQQALGKATAAAGSREPIRRSPDSVLTTFRRWLDGGACGEPISGVRAGFAVAVSLASPEAAKTFPKKFEKIAGAIRRRIVTARNPLQR